CSAEATHVITIYPNANPTADLRLIYDVLRSPVGGSGKLAMVPLPMLEEPRRQSRLARGRPLAQPVHRRARPSTRSASEASILESQVSSARPRKRRAR